MVRSYETDEIVRRVSELIRPTPGPVPAVRELARHVALSAPALYRYFPSMTELVDHVEREVWRVLCEGPSEESPAERLASLAMESPGWLTLLSDFNRPHHVPSSAPTAFRFAGDDHTSLDLILGYLCSRWQFRPDPPTFRQQLADVAPALAATAGAVERFVRDAESPRAPAVDAHQLFDAIVAGVVAVDPEIRALVGFVRDHQRFPSVREVTDLFGTTIGGLYGRSSKRDLFARMSVGLFHASAHFVMSRSSSDDPAAELFGAWLTYVAVTIQAPYLAAMQVDWTDWHQNPTAFALQSLTKKYCQALPGTGLPPLDLSLMLMGLVMRRGHQHPDAVTYRTTLDVVDEYLRRALRDEYRT